MKKLMASECVFLKCDKDFEITRNNALDIYLSEDCFVIGLLEEYIYENFNEEEILEYQDKFINRTIIEVNELLDKERTYENLLEIMHKIVLFNGLFTLDKNTLEKEYNLYMRLYEKYGYSIDSGIKDRGEDRENVFSSRNFKPLVYWNFDHVYKYLDSVGRLVKNNKSYGGLLANAKKLNDDELIFKILKTMAVNSFKNNNTKPDFTDKPIEETPLHEKMAYIELKDFLKDFDINFDIDKEIE